MKALRIKREITSDRLPELNNYKGKNVEIIILSNLEEEKNINLLNEMIGICPSLIDGMQYQKEIRKEWER